MSSLRSLQRSVISAQLYKKRIKHRNLSSMYHKLKSKKEA